MTSSYIEKKTMGEPRRQKVCKIIKKVKELPHPIQNDILDRIRFYVKHVFRVLALPLITVRKANSYQVALYGVPEELREAHQDGSSDEGGDSPRDECKEVTALF